MKIGVEGKKEVCHLILFLLLSYFFFFFNLGSYSLKEPDEGRYAEISREMVEQGEYVVPHLNYVRYFEKPPLLYWVTAVSYKLFGVNEWSFRFPNALVALFSGILLFYFGKKWFSSETGFFSALILISCFGFFTMARIVTTDMLFAGLLFAALLCFNEYYRESKRAYLYLFYLFLAMATLAKGPVAIILAGVTILIYLLIEKKLSFLKSLLDTRGVLFYLAIATPWFLIMSFKEKEFFQFFFIDQNILRFLTTKHHRSGPIYYFIPVLAVGMLPWSFFLPRAIIELWRARELRLFFIWAAVVFLFFSFSGSKLPPYLLPVFPALSLVLGHLFASQRQKFIPVRREIVFYIIFLAGIMLAGFLSASGIILKYIRIESHIQDILQHVKGLEIGLIVVSAVMIYVLCMKHIRRFGPLFSVLTGFSLVVILMLMFHVDVIDAQKTTKGLAKVINNFKSQTAMIINYGSFEETLPFYVKRRIYIAGYEGELSMGARYPDTQPFFIGEESFKALFDSSQPVLVVSKVTRLPRLAMIIAGGFNVIDCQDNRCVIANRAANQQILWNRTPITNNVDAFL